jgi:hypothetical protein
LCGLDSKVKLRVLLKARPSVLSFCTASVLENCRHLGINPKEYLIDVLTRLPGILAKDAIALTPANWLNARNGKAARKIA